MIKQKAKSMPLHESENVGKEMPHKKDTMGASFGKKKVPAKDQSKKKKARY